MRTLAVDMFVTNYYLLVNDRAITSVTADISIIALDRYKVNTIMQYLMILNVDTKTQVYS